jgi:CRP-like cAMP-binding protein
MEPHLETMQLALDHVLFEPGGVVSHVYFPETTGVSLLSIKDGRTTMASTVGCEGIVGLEMFLNQPTSAFRASVHLAGVACRMTATVFRQLAASPGPLHQPVLLYTSRFLAQILEAHRCNAAHTVEERTADWIRVMSERGQTLELPLDLELFARVLSVHRAAVAVSLRALQRRGVIDYHRQQLHVLDHSRLEALSCKCTQVGRA